MTNNEHTADRTAERFMDFNGYRVGVRWANIYDPADSALIVSAYRLDNAGEIIWDGSHIVTDTLDNALALIAGARRLEQETEHAS